MHELQKRARRKYQDLIGEKFNSLTIIGLSHKTKAGHYYFKCRCDCGYEKVIKAQKVISGETKTCGCRNKGFNFNTMHGITRKEPHLYSIWNTMRHRCYNPKHHKYQSYGGRGIKVCDEWLNNYIPFREWALNNGYNEKLSIDRIDNDKDYSPLNCRWATCTEQANNRRTTRMLTHNGETKPFMTWCRELNLPQSTVRARLDKLGWSVKEALETPIQVRINKTQSSTQGISVK